MFVLCFFSFLSSCLCVCVCVCVFYVSCPLSSGVSVADVSTWLSVYVTLCLCVSVCMCVHLCVSVYIYVCLCASMCVSVSVGRDVLRASRAALDRLVRRSIRT